MSTGELGLASASAETTTEAEATTRTMNLDRDGLAASLKAGLACCKVRPDIVDRSSGVFIVSSKIVRESVTHKWCLT